MESARGRRDREKFLRRTRGMRGLECILHGPRLPGRGGGGYGGMGLGVRARHSASCSQVPCYSSNWGAEPLGYPSLRFHCLQD